MKRVWAILCIIMLAALGLALTARAQNGDREELFYTSNQHYKNGNFQQAVDGYRHLIQSGQSSGQVYYNLGNAYFRTQDLGRAILNYERAMLRMPRNADLKFNLSMARDQTQDVVPPSQSFTGLLFAWLASVTLSELFWSFAVLNGLFMAILITRLFIRREWNYYLLILLTVLWIPAGVSFGMRHYQIWSDQRAVVLVREMNVYAGPDTGDTVLFKLHQGTIVSEERSEDNWSLVRLTDNKRGWARAEAVERIRAVP